MEEKYANCLKWNSPKIRVQTVQVIKVVEFVPSLAFALTMRQDRHIFQTFLLVAVAFVSSCAKGSLSARNCQPPSWWFSPRKHDAGHLYFTAQSTNFRSHEDASSKARGEVRSKLIEYISAKRVDFKNSLQITSEFLLKDPHGDRDEVIAYIRDYEIDGTRPVLRVMLENKWRDAQSLINRQQFTDGEWFLIAIIHSCGKALRVSFELEAVKLELGTLYQKQNSSLRARHLITDVQKTTVLPELRRRADVMVAQTPSVSLGDSFEGLIVGLYCGRRTDDVLIFDSDLSHKLNTRLAQQGIRTVVTRSSALANIQVLDDDLSGHASAIAEGLCNWNICQRDTPQPASSKVT